MAKITLFYGEEKEVGDEIAELNRQFEKEYAFIYETQREGKHVVGYSEALDFGDEMIRSHHPLLVEFVKAREDALVSDREVAAFAFAAAELGYV